MAAMTDYLENQLADFLLRGQSFTPSSNTYIALFTDATTDAGGGTEVSAGGYARVEVVSNTTNWKGTDGATGGASSGTDGQVNNAVEFTFNPPSANWGTITNYALFDLPTGGNMLIHGTLTQSKTVNNGDAAPKFAVNDLRLTFA